MGAGEGGTPIGGGRGAGTSGPGSPAGVGARPRLPADTFALKVKEELCAQPRSAAQARAELHGLIRAAGSLLVSGAAAAPSGSGPQGGSGARQQGSPALACEVRCTRPVVVRRVYRLLRDALGARPVLLVRRSAGRAGGRFVCRLADARSVLGGLGLTDRAGRPRDHVPAALRRRPLAAAMVRGFFLGAGSIDDPTRDHHLEFEVDGGSWGVAEDLVGALAALGVRAHRARRRGRILIYLKDAAAITTLLAAMGAGASLLAYEEQCIRRQVRSAVNRLVNAETANLEKAAATGAEQALALRSLAGGRLDDLPEGLRAVALARLGHPEASLRELGQLLHPPLGKSGVQHRLAALRAFLAGGPGERAGRGRSRRPDGPGGRV